jgi:hypothetical protein
MDKQSSPNADRPVFRTQRGFEVSLLPRAVLSAKGLPETKSYPLLVDDVANTSLGSQLDDLRSFILSQPPTTAFGVGYMRDGTVDIVQNLTDDHTLAARALRLPLGITGAMASPYLSLGDLIKRWPESPVRREILMVTDGIDRFGGVGPANPYVDTAVEQAERAGIIMYAIYTTGIGHFGHTFWRYYWSQNYLSQRASETGGEAYFLGYETPVSFTPYLHDLSRRLTHQNLLTFLAKPGKKAGFEPVKEGVRQVNRSRRCR